MPLNNPDKVAAQCLRSLRRERDRRLLRLSAYARGDQDLPYTPEGADAEYQMLAERSITNVFPFLAGTVTQMMKADSFRRGRKAGDGADDLAITDALDAVQPEWDHWQKSRMDARQGAIYSSAVQYGHSFVLTYSDPIKGVLSKGLSPLKTVALYEDPGADDDPYVALSITRWPAKDDTDPEKIKPGLATMWDDTYEYPVVFKSLDDLKGVKVSAGKRHGAAQCPVTRFAAAVDLEGRTCGIIEPMIRLQDRINQTVFDLLIVQSFASFKVRTISGIAPPIKMKAVDIDGNTVEDPARNEDLVDHWVPVIDPSTGRPVPDEVNLNARRAFWAEDEDTKFGTLDETPLDGFIKAIDLAFRHMAALSQTPPHHILGEISNLSAEALNAAETALLRKVGEFKAMFGEAWERVFRVAAEIGGYEGAEDFAGEIIWRDLDNTNLVQTADALIKLKELDIPGPGLWGRVPNVTANEKAEWQEMYRAQNAVLDANVTTQANRATTSTRPGFRLQSVPPAEEAVA